MEPFCVVLYDVIIFQQYIYIFLHIIVQFLSCTNRKWSTLTPLESGELWHFHDDRQYQKNEVSDQFVFLLVSTLYSSNTDIDRLINSQLSRKFRSWRKYNFRHMQQLMNAYVATKLAKHLKRWAIWSETCSMESWTHKSQPHHHTNSIFLS